MPRSSFGLTTLWSSLTVLSVCGTASAQWFSGSGSSCGCSAPTYMGPPPIMRSTASLFGAAPAMPASYASYGGSSCGSPIACHIEQPAQVVHVQACAPVTHQIVSVQPMQQVHQPVIQHVAVTEYQPVKRTVAKPVVTTEYVDQAVTEMRPVSELRTVNVASVDYQTVTEYKTVKKNVGYWVTKNVPTNKMAPWQYDNRPNAAGAINRASYAMQTAFTPNYRQVRQYVPQTMTCTVPCQRQVAVPSMKQVTYNVSSMQAVQTTRKVAVNKVVYQNAEVTVMAPVQTVKAMQVGTRISHVPMGSVPGATGTALKPTPDANSSVPSRTATPSNSMDSNMINNRGAYVEPIDPLGNRLSDNWETVKPIESAEQPVKRFSAPTVVRVSQWVAHNPVAAPANPQPGVKSAAMSIADSAR